MNPESVDQKPHRAIAEEDEDSMDSFSTLSDYDFVEFSEWDAKFNQLGGAGEVPPPPDVCPSHVGRSTTTGGDAKAERSNTVHRYPNGRRGCKQLAVLQRQLMLKKQEKHTRDDYDDNNDDDDDKGYDADEAQIVQPPPAKRQCCVALTNPQGPKDESSSSVIAYGYEIVGITTGTQSAHPRHGCTHYRFEFYDAENPSTSWADRTKVNQKHCSMCYCYLCEVKADLCPDFAKHCNANDRDSMKSYWKYQRHRIQEEVSNRHFRFQCSIHLFRNHRNNSCPWPVEMWEQRSWFNKRFCRDCVCFVCNMPVLECAEWPEHCK